MMGHGACECGWYTYNLALTGEWKRAADGGQEYVAVPGQLCGGCQGRMVSLHVPASESLVLPLHAEAPLIDAPPDLL